MIGYTRTGGGGGGGSSKEPYIYNVGDTAFNTGYIHNANTSIKCRLLVTPIDGYRVIFGARNNNSNNNAFVVWTNFGGTRIGIARTGNEAAGNFFAGNEWQTRNNVMIYDRPVILEASGGTVTVTADDGTPDTFSITSTGTVDSGIAPLALFALNNSNTADAFTNIGDRQFNLYFYWLEIYENDELLHRYVPTFNLGQWCLYDEIADNYLYDTISSGKYLVGKYFPTILSTTREFTCNGISSTAWTATDGTTTLTKDAGTYEVATLEDEHGTYLLCDANNGAYYSFPVTNSYGIFGIACAIDSSFTPVNTNDWYNCSCILGQELGGSMQKDFGILIDKNGYFAMGSYTSSVLSSTVSALDGNLHELFIVVDLTQVRLFIDGVLAVTYSTAISGSNINNLGVMWNKANNSNTKVYGKVYAVGAWTRSEPVVDGSDLPTLTYEQH